MRIDEGGSQDAWTPTPVRAINLVKDDFETILASRISKTEMHFLLDWWCDI
jgi:hypothetical protein